MPKLKIAIILMFITEWPKLRIITFLRATVLWHSMMVGFIRDFGKMACQMVVENWLSAMGPLLKENSTGVPTSNPMVLASTKQRNVLKSVLSMASKWTDSADLKTTWATSQQVSIPRVRWKALEKFVLQMAPNRSDITRIIKETA